jgi:hypothetical protein
LQTPGRAALVVLGRALLADPAVPLLARRKRARCAVALSAPVGPRQDDPPVELHAQRVGDRLDALEARAGVARRLVALDLLLLQAEPLG